MPAAHHFALLPLMLAASGCGTRPDPEPYTIGHVAAFSGSQQISGEHARRGASLAVEEALRENRRVLGRKVVVRHVDSRGNPELVRAEAVRLITLNRVVALLGGPDTDLSEQLTRVARNYTLPVLLPADTVMLPTGTSVFGLNAAPETRGELLARFAAHDLGCKHIAVLTDSREAVAQSLATAFTKRWRREHRNDQDAPVAQWTYPDESDTADWIQRVQSAQPDGILAALGSEQTVQLRARLKAANCKTPLLFGGEDAGTTPFAELHEEGPALYLATAFTALGDLGTAGRSFVREYEDKYHESPDLAAALAYDGVGLLIDALERAKTARPERLCSALAASAEFASVTGPLALVERRAKRRLFVVKIAGREQRVVATSVAEAD